MSFYAYFEPPFLANICEVQIQVQVLQMILISVTSNILSTTLSGHHIQKWITLKVGEIQIFKNIPDYIDSFLTLQCNLEHILYKIYDIFEA